MSITQTEKSAIRDYLLGHKSASDEEIEERLMTDNEFFKELQIQEEELIQDYVDETLSNSEKQKFENHFLISKERQEKLMFARALRNHINQKAEEIETEPVVDKTSTKSEKQSLSSFFSSIFSSPVPVAICLIIIAGLSLAIIWNNVLTPSDNETALASLNKAYKNERPIESRISGLDYAPNRKTRGGDDSKIIKLELKNAEIQINNNVLKNRNAENLHALGKLYLAKKDYDSAITELKEAEELDKTNVEIKNDLAVAHLEIAKLAKQDDDGEKFYISINSSLSNLNEALRINNNYLEALFNKALVIQMMKTPGESIQAWNNYLNIDSSSLWAEEAKQNLEKLKNRKNLSKDNAQILKDFLNSYNNQDEAKAWSILSETKEFITGAMVMQQLIKGMLNASLNGDIEKKKEFLSAFQFLGEVEKRETNDSYFLNLADFYKNANSSQLKYLSKAHNKVEQAQKQLIKPDFDNAIRDFEEANELFLSVGNKWEAGLVEYQSSYCLAQINKIELSNQKLIQLSTYGKKKGYKWIQALADGWIGNNFFSLGEVSNSLHYDEKSLSLANEISDVYKLQRGHLGLANQYSKLNNLSKSLNHIYSSVHHPIKYHLPQRQNWRNLIFTSEVLFSFGLFDASSVYASEEIQFAQTELKDNWIKHSSLVNASIIYSKLQNYDEALALADKSKSLIDEFPDNKLKRELKGISLTTIANLQRQNKNCNNAIQNFNLAIEIFDSLSLPIRLYEARKGRLLCYVDKKKDSLIKEELPIILEIFDKNRQVIKNETDRNHYFDDRQDIYDIATDYTYSQMNDVEQAFDYSESSRARSLLDKMNNGVQSSTKTLTLSDVIKINPEQVQIVYYSVLKDKVIIWHINNNTLTSVEHKISQVDLERLIKEYSVNVVEQGNTEKKSLLAQKLYSILLEPIEEKLVEKKTICFIPDKNLFRIPFSALIAPRTQKYVIEEYPVLISPSASVFIKQNENARLKSIKEEEKLLAIGNPKFSTNEFPTLRDLPSAEHEALAIDKMYDNSNVFIGKDATKEKIIENFSNADIIHFAGHYIPNAKSPNSSKLILASQKPIQSDNDLSVDELNNSNSLLARLIVLAACDSGAENFYNGEGMIGASRAFLALNVPVVVASQWKVDSEATAELMKRFHRYRKRKNMRTVDALRKAQIDLINDTQMEYESPYYWAGFLTIGSYSDY